MKRFITAAILVATLAGCHGYQVHPGAVNKTDSVTYDVLLQAKGVIDIGRGQIASGALPVSVKPAFNNLVAAYNVAYPAYEAWHTALIGGQPTAAQQAQLEQYIGSLTKALGVFKSAK